MSPDAVVIGSGPNGLAAAVTLARAGLSVELYEAAATIGGGLRTEALFDPDVVHDVCSAVHPLAVASPFFRSFDLAARGVTFHTPEASYGHPLPGGRAALAWRSLERTCAGLGQDGRAWHRLMQPLIEHSQGITRFFLSDLRTPPQDVMAPVLAAARMLRHGTSLADRQFTGDDAGALLAGVAAHAVGKLPSLVSAALTVLLGHLAHTTGWPLPEGGSARIADALAADITAHGGKIHTGRRVHDLAELGRAKVVLADVAPTGLLQIAGGRLPAGYARALARYRHGPAAAKADFLVSEPVPWANSALRQAPTVHLGGTQRAIHRQETSTARGIATEHPFVLLVQPDAADPTRARPGKHPVWAYAHVPHGDRRDPGRLIRSAIETCAPGFTDTIVAERTTTAAQLAEYNPNYVGGDIGTGAITLRQMLFRPVPRWNPYRTPLDGVYLCSAATPPGPAVHGMSGHLAALSALRREFGVHRVDLGPTP